MLLITPSRILVRWSFYSMKIKIFQKCARNADSVGRRLESFKSNYRKGLLLSYSLEIIATVSKFTVGKISKLMPKYYCERYRHATAISATGLVMHTDDIKLSFAKLFATRIKASMLCVVHPCRLVL